MDFREYRAARNGDELVITGSVHEPVHWDFSFRVCQDDVPGLVKMIAGPSMLRFVVSSLLRRKKHHHWSNDLKEHRAEVKVHIRELKEKLAKQELDLGDKLGKAAAAASAAAASTSASAAASQPAANASRTQPERAAALATVGGSSTNGHAGEDIVLGDESDS